LFLASQDLGFDHLLNIRNIDRGIHKEKLKKMQPCIKILLFHIYMKLNMFQATHRPSSGA